MVLSVLCALYHLILEQPGDDMAAIINIPICQMRELRLGGLFKVPP